jgi:hypothetical protein
VSVLLVCLSGYLRYRAPRQRQRSLEERKRAIQEQMELDALKQQQRARQAWGMVGILRGAVHAAREPMDQEAASPRVTGTVAAEGQEVNVAPAVPLPPPSALPMAWPRLPTTPASTPSNGHYRP